MLFTEEVRMKMNDITIVINVQVQRNIYIFFFVTKYCYEIYFVLFLNDYGE